MHLCKGSKEDSSSVLALYEVYAVRNGELVIREEVGRWISDKNEFLFTSADNIWYHRKY